MEHVLTFVLAHLLPLMLVSTALYVAFSVTVCSAARVFPTIETYFVSKVSKTIPLIAIAAVLAAIRMC